MSRLATLAAPRMRHHAHTHPGHGHGHPRPPADHTGHTTTQQHHSLHLTPYLPTRRRYLVLVILQLVIIINQHQSSSPLHFTRYSYTYSPSSTSHHHHTPTIFYNHRTHTLARANTCTPHAASSGVPLVSPSHLVQPLSISICF
jgi:hypothetical protein